METRQVSRFGEVRLLKDIHVSGKSFRVYRQDIVWDSKLGIYRQREFVDLAETYEIPSNPEGMRTFRRYSGVGATQSGRVVWSKDEQPLMSGGQWMRKGQVYPVAHMPSIKGVRVWTGFGSPNKVQYLHHDDFVWVQKTDEVKAWTLQPEDMY